VPLSFSSEHFSLFTMLILPMAPLQNPIYSHCPHKQDHSQLKCSARQNSPNPQPTIASNTSLVYTDIPEGPISRFKEGLPKPGIVGHTCNPNIWEAEAKGLRV
jgi:hypothetical protein